MITTLRALSTALRRWRHKQQIRRKIARGHRSRARRAQEREAEVLRHDAQRALELARDAIALLPPCVAMKYARRVEQLSSRIERK